MAAGQSIAGLLKWVRRDEWRESREAHFDLHLERPCAKAGVRCDELPSLLGDGLFTNLWGCVFEDFVAQDDDGGRNIADDYLKRRGWKESASNKAYIAALRTSVMSLYEVSDVVPGESFLARDLVRGGDPMRVSERLGTRQLKQWDRIGTRVVPLRSKNVMGGGVLLFEQDVAEELLTLLRRVMDKGRRRSLELVQKIDQEIEGATLGEGLSDNEMLRYAVPLFTSVWLGDVLDRVLHPRMPALCNTDGDELVLTTIRYPLAPGAAAGAVGAALGRLSELRETRATLWKWVDETRPGYKKPGPVAVAPGEFITTSVTDATDGSTVLGDIALKEDALILSVNSRARAERGQAMLAPVLDGLVSTPVVASQTLEQLMASPSDQEDRAAREARRPAGLSAEEERAIVHEFLDQHYARLLNEKVPMLGHERPRQAATTADGREKLVAWLKYLENQSAKHDAGNPMAGYDFRWLWDELGIANLRR